jgi:LacI family transcriptional regulator
MAVTIKQIAELANVSRGTVDKVLNERPGVKNETRNKVLQIAKELNYHPNLLGKALVQSKAPVKIGIIFTPEYNPFIQEMLIGVKNATAEYSDFGIEVITRTPISLEVSEEIALLNELEREGVSGIAVFPIDDNAVRNKINQMTSNGIAVVTFNSKLEGTQSLCFVGQDHKKGGKTAAGLMSKLLPPSGQIGVIISSFNLSCHQNRLEGFRNRCKESWKNLEIVEVQENQDRKEDAFKITLEYFNQYPDIKGIYITGGGVSGVGNALNLLNKTKTTTLICHDIISDTVQLLRNDTVDFALGQSPETQGYHLVKILFDYLIKRQNPVTDFFEMPVTIVTKDSL